ncbi:MAG: saccharopine dehydrogenase C-terminal domain-containing protein [Planctomycetota bacterium]
MTHYLVLGAGLQGTAAVYDLVKHCDADLVTWLELDPARLEAGLRRMEELGASKGLRGQSLDVTDHRALQPHFGEADVCVNALPYRFSISMTMLALEGRCHYLDLGGNTEVVREQLELHVGHPSAAELCVLPDCGLMPGMGNLLVAYAVAELGPCARVSVRCGGLPQDPKPPLGYALSFNVAGLTNEYFGQATVLRDGKPVDVATFGEVEEFELPRVGPVEAFITSGGLSTTPWTFAGQIGSLDYKTVRYRGHHAKFTTLVELGLLQEDPVLVDGHPVVPRHLLHERLTACLPSDDRRDLVTMTCQAEAADGGRRLAIELFDEFDPETGFTAMERTTAWSTTICAHDVARGKIAPGPRPLESAVDPHDYLRSLVRRGFDVTVDDSAER